MAAPFAVCVILVLMHAALGRHVLARGVVFADLALAQFAALGTAIGLARGHEAGTPFSYGWSFALTLAGAAVFSFLWDRRQPMLQEAFIGIAFATASALAMLVLAGLPHGAERFHAIIGGGGLFWLAWRDVGVLAGLYALAGWFLWRARKALWLCSTDPGLAARRGLSLRRWDFLFYAVFGLVVTSSVRFTGVLSVFAFLIVPLVCARQLGRTGAAELPAAWTLGTAGALAAVTASYVLDWPTGATVVAVFGTMAAALTAWRRLASRRASGPRAG
jgi:zinc/manganese transport system permease protein